MVGEDDISSDLFFFIQINMTLGRVFAIGPGV